MTCSQAHRHIAAMGAYFPPHLLAENSSSRAAAASDVAARYISLSAAATAFLSCHEQNSSELRIKCTMHVCTHACGNTAVIASGKPFSPSTTEIRMSSTPRLRSSFMTLSQNFAPSFCSIHIPRTSLQPSSRIASARYTALFFTVPSSRIFTRSASKKNHRVEPLQGSVLPLAYRFHHRVGHRADEVRRDLHFILLEQEALDLPHCHPPPIHGNDSLIELRKPKSRMPQKEGNGRGNSGGISPVPVIFPVKTVARTGKAPRT